MVIETRSPKETFEFGKKIGELAKAGEIYTLIGDLGVGKTVLRRDWQEGFRLKRRLAARHSQSYRYMRREGFRFIILTYIGLGILRKWKRSDMKITSMVKEYL